MSCCCGSEKNVKLLYACSGAANTGALADQVWRKLKGSGVGSGTCLAAVGADYGVEKGKTEITQDIIDRVSHEIQNRIEACNG